MNTIGEILNVDKAICREFDINQINKYIRSTGYIWMSWGFHSPTIIKTNKMYRFTVHGYHHKGFVYIVLNFMDTFDIYYTTYKNKIKKISKDVYIQELIDVLDTDIEKIKEYFV